MRGEVLGFFQPLHPTSYACWQRLTRRFPREGGNWLTRPLCMSRDPPVFLIIHIVLKTRPILPCISPASLLTTFGTEATQSSQMIQGQAARVWDRDCTPGVSCSHPQHPCGGFFPSPTASMFVPLPNTNMRLHLPGVLQNFQQC